jgi:hypothetical protein
MYKKITLLTFSLMVYLFTCAQITYFKAGITESFLHDKTGNSSQNYHLRTGYQIGFFAEIPLNEKINVRPSIQLSQKGFKEVEGALGTSFYWNRNFSTNYLELPINVAYRIDLNKNTFLQIGTGPVFGIGLFGKNKTILTSVDSTQHPYTQYWEGTDAFSKRFDFGWDFLVSFKLRCINIQTSYNHGFHNLLNDGDHKAKNRSFALTIGYPLKKKKY